ncbi:MAG: hypothetical protein AAGA66_21455, partial [Bacteroidota bacterium]
AIVLNEIEDRYIFGCNPMNITKNFTKDDLKTVYDQYFESIRGFLYYKTRDIDLSEDLVQEVFRDIHRVTPKDIPILNFI